MGFEYSKEHNQAESRMTLHWALGLLSVLVGASFLVAGVTGIINSGWALLAVIGSLTATIVGIVLTGVGFWSFLKGDRIYNEDVRRLRTRDLSNYYCENTSYETRRYVTESLMGVSHSRDDHPIQGGDIITHGGHEIVC